MMKLNKTEMELPRAQNICSPNRKLKKSLMKPTPKVSLMNVIIKEA